MYQAHHTTISKIVETDKLDNLVIAFILGEPALVTKDYRIGDEVIYFPADTQLSQEFAKAMGVLREDGGFVEPNRRIRAIKLRDVYSEGLAMRVSAVKEKFPELNSRPGDSFTHIGSLEIAKRYTPPFERKVNGGGGKTRTSHKWHFPEFREHVDTKQLRFMLDSFLPGDQISISLKLHGTSQRSAYTIKEHKRGFLRRLFRIPPKRTWEKVLGTRRTVPQQPAPFRQKHHDALAPFLEKGMEVYYEIVGFEHDGRPIMPTGKKLPGYKAEYSTFDFGLKAPESEMYIYRITAPDGRELTPMEIAGFALAHGLKSVPILDFFTFTTVEDLMARVEALVGDEYDPIWQDQVMEGLVVRIVNRGSFTAYKHKTHNFKLIEGVIKDSGVIDMEEGASQGE